MSAQARRYVMQLEFGAADDAQASRLAQAWADTCAAEYGTKYLGFTEVVPRHEADAPAPDECDGVSVYACIAGTCSRCGDDGR